MTLFSGFFDRNVKEITSNFAASFFFIFRSMYLGDFCYDLILLLWKKQHCHLRS